MIASPWAHRIERAEELARSQVVAAEILGFYAEIVRFQKAVYERLGSFPSLADVFVLKPHVPSLLSLVERIGPGPLAQAARELAQANEPLYELIGGLGDSVVERDFFARSLLQPYYEFLAGRSNDVPRTMQALCPVCTHKPVVAVLRGEGEGGKRSLVCSLCATEWNFRRLLCPNCGEEAERKLPVYVAEEFPHVRIEACDTCRTYIKAVDLTKNGLAVPVVDELASVALNLWAHERGYTKLQPNLLGM